ncbi:unnamed protein product [Peniophora sp. CBMAI 1063]|nr:unnamed protein product [Peniophora sp. CBMAI 1063]
MMHKLAPELVAATLHYVDTLSLARLSHVNFSLRALCQAELRNRIVREVGKHVKDPRRLLTMLGEAGGVVSGSTALAVALAGSAWDDVGGWQSMSDLDVYLPGEEHLLPLVTALCETEGYEAVDLPNKDDQSYWEDQARIRSITRLRNSTYSTHIDIICAWGGAATLTLPAFWGTIVMNFITNTALVVSYPGLTFEGRGFVNDGVQRDRTERNRRKYESRGFTVGAYKHDDEACSSDHTYCPSLLRYTEDAQSMKMIWNDEGARRKYHANSPALRGTEFTTTPSFWRWSHCEKITGDHGGGYMVGRL